MKTTELISPKFSLLGALHPKKSMEKAKALRLIGKFCRARVPLDVDPLQNAGEIPKSFQELGFSCKYDVTRQLSGRDVEDKLLGGT